MQKQSEDNVSAIFIAFKNFENRMKDPDFEYTANAKTQLVKEQFDFSKQIWKKIFNDLINKIFDFSILMNLFM